MVVSEVLLELPVDGTVVCEIRKEGVVVWVRERRLRANVAGHRHVVNERMSIILKELRYLNECIVHDSRHLYSIWQSINDLLSQERHLRPDSIVQHDSRAANGLTE